MGADSLCTMSKKANFQRRVSERTQRIAGDAKARTSQRNSEEFKGYYPEPSLAERIANRLPESVRSRIRELMGPDPKVEQGRSLLNTAREQMTDVRNREAALEAARRELSKRERRHTQQSMELQAATVDLEKFKSEAQRAADQANVERRIPLGEIDVCVERSPRPIRGINRLAQNVKRFGQLTPVVVRSKGDRFELVTGYRRMAALKQSQYTHALCRVVDDLDDATAAALYTVENCFVDGVSSNAVRHLAKRVEGRKDFEAVLPFILSDDDEVIEDVYLEDMAEEAQHHLAEGAAWVSSLRPYWGDLGVDERAPLEELVLYFAQLSSRMKRD